MSVDKFGRHHYRSNEQVVKKLREGLKQSILDLQNQIHEVHKDITRDPPVAGNHLSNKKYVDDSIVRAKTFLRKEINLIQKNRIQKDTQLEQKISNSISKIEVNLSKKVNELSDENKMTASKISDLSKQMHEFKNDLDIFKQEMTKNITDAANQNAQIMMKTLEIEKKIKTADLNSHDLDERLNVMEDYLLHYKANGTTN